MRTHDLLRLKPADASRFDDAPPWVARSLERAPFVVVRRGEIDNNLIPVGIRGQARNERHAALLDAANVAGAITPEALASPDCWRDPARTSLPAFAALHRVAEMAAQLALAWGPVGSVGFELASGVPTVNANSDLDLIVRPTPAHTREDLALLRRLSVGGVRIDVLIEAQRGAVALDEWLESPGYVLIKTNAGPRLGAFAW